MPVFINIVNRVLYFAYETINQIFEAFGLTWIGVVVGLAVISTILRLFAANLVGTSLNIYRSQEQASKQQRIEKQKAKASTGQGASFSSNSHARWNRGLKRSQMDLGQFDPKVVYKNRRKD